MNAQVDARMIAEELFRRVTKRDERPTVGLSAFKARLYKRYQHARHLAVLDGALEQVTRYVETGGRAGIGRLIVEMPPRHGKSLTISRLYPAWHLGRNPAHRIMLVSYGADLAWKHSKAARNFMRSPIYREMFRTRLAPDSQAMGAWDVAGDGGIHSEGGMDALGIDGGAAGKGAHVLIIDDPVKNRAQAESATYRENTWEAFRDDLYTRLEPSAAIILVMTRWHMDDLVGRAVKYMADEGWVRLRMPSIYPEDEQRRIPSDFEDWRQPGDALWPERYPAEALLQIRASLGAYPWSGLHDQNPTPSEGGIFKRAWFSPLIRHAPMMVKAVRFWDLAMSQKTSADYTAGVKMGRAADGHHYILDVARAQVELADLPRFLKDVTLADGPGVLQGFEDKGYMTRAIQALAKDRELARYSIKGYPMEGDKLTRALPFAARCSLGIMHVVDAPWAEVYVEEVAAFPNGANDDQVDASSGAWEMINEEQTTLSQSMVRRF